MKRIALMIGVKAKDRQELALEVFEFLKGNGIQVSCLQNIAEWLNAKDTCTCRDEKELFDNADLVITIGGDGTILYAARLIAERGIPVCGLNMGRLGFLNELTFENWRKDLQKILDGEYWIEERFILSGQLLREGKVIEKWVAVNDVILSRIGYPHLITVDVLLDGVPTITYPGDGVIVATPTGSTAYSLSAGGPIVSPEMDAIVVTPICAHDFYARPWVLSGKTVVELQGDYRSKEYGITVDGEIFIPCQENDRITIQESPWKMKLLRLKDSGHYRNLRTRFHRKAQL